MISHYNHLKSLPAPTVSRLGSEREEAGIGSMAAKQQQRREQLAEMVLELQANQVALLRLRDWYGVFIFTGGPVPNAPQELLAIDAYLERPFASDRIIAQNVARYRQLVELAMHPAQDITAGPRTGDCRSDIGRVFDQELSEIQALAGGLETVWEELLAELGPPFPASRGMSHARNVYCREFENIEGDCDPPPRLCNCPGQKVADGLNDSERAYDGYRSLGAKT